MGISGVTPLWHDTSNTVVFFSEWSLAQRETSCLLTKITQRTYSLTCVLSSNERQRRISLYLARSNSDLQCHICILCEEGAGSHILISTTSGRRGSCRSELSHYCWRLSVSRSSAGWLDYREWDRSHLWAKPKLLSAKMNILIRQLSSHPICTLVTFERGVDCF